MAESSDDQAQLEEPGEIPCDTTNSDTVRQEFVKLNDYCNRLDALRAESLELLASSQKLLRLSLGFCERDLVTCASEIWKRILRMRRKAIGDGKELFDPNIKDLVMGGAITMEMEDPILEMEEMSWGCIVVGDDRIRYSTTKSLEAIVRGCQTAMEVFPTLQQSHVHQWSTISHYERFKELFPESFKDLVA